MFGKRPVLLLPLPLMYIHTLHGVYTQICERREKRRDMPMKRDIPLTCSCKRGEREFLCPVLE